MKQQRWLCLVLLIPPIFLTRGCLAAAMHGVHYRRIPTNHETMSCKAAMYSWACALRSLTVRQQAQHTLQPGIGQGKLHLLHRCARFQLQLVLVVVLGQLPHQH